MRTTQVEIEFPMVDFLCLDIFPSSSGKYPVWPLSTQWLDSDLLGLSTLFENSTD